MTLGQLNTQVEIVVTVPEVLGVEFSSHLGIRTTLGVLTELLASARSNVMIAAPFIQSTEVFHSTPLGLALFAAFKRGVQVDVLSTGASLARSVFEELREIAGARLRMFQPRENIEDPRILGSHAKFCLCDGQHAYIGSANLTKMGMSQHFELGVLLHGKAAQEVFGLIRALIEVGCFVLC